MDSIKFKYKGYPFKLAVEILGNKIRWILSLKNLELVSFSNVKNEDLENLIALYELEENNK